MARRIVTGQVRRNNPKNQTLNILRFASSNSPEKGRTNLKMMAFTNIKGYVVLLLFLLCLSSTTGVTLLKYGPDAGDLEWYGREDDQFLNVDLSRAFPFGGVLRENVTIDDNGNLNFDGESYDSNGFGPDYYEETLIGILWDDLDPDCPSPQTHVYYRETTDSVVLFDISLSVRQIHAVPDFLPTWAFLVTWENYRAGRYASDLDFQAVLATDGTNSYVVFLYGHLNNDIDAEIGVTAYNKTSDTNRYDHLCTDNHEDRDLVNRKQSVCQGKPGVMSFRTDVIENRGVCFETIIDSGCSSDTNCTTGNTTHCPRCNTGLATCVECLIDGDCTTAANPHCDTSIGWCVTCTANQHCMDPNLPHCDSTVGRKCKECLLHRHCSQDPKRVCTADKRCIECLDSSHCRDLTKPVCDSETCVCLTNADCGSNRICDVTTRQCVCLTDNKPCNGLGMTCESSGQCDCMDGYVSTSDGKCSLDCNPPCAVDETCSVERKCLTACVDPDSDNCPSDKNAVTFQSCVKQGRLGGDCVSGSCFGLCVRCNAQTNKCECRDRCKPRMICRLGLFT